MAKKKKSKSVTLTKQKLLKLLVRTIRQWDDVDLATFVRNNADIDTSKRSGARLYALVNYFIDEHHTLPMRVTRAELDDLVC